MTPKASQTCRFDRRRVGNLNYTSDAAPTEVLQILGGGLHIMPDTVANGTTRKLIAGTQAQHVVDASLLGEVITA